MPEATVLYTVTAVVVLGLIAWVAAVLMTAKQPWARASVPRPAGGEGRPLPPSDTGPTATATPVPLASASEAAKDEKDIGP